MIDDEERKTVVSQIQCHIVHLTTRITILYCIEGVLFPTY